MGKRIETQQIVVSDRIHETLVLRTSRGRAWLAISDAKDFGAWFGAVFDQPFAEGVTVRGRFTRPAVAANTTDLDSYPGRPVELVVTRVEAARCVSFVWHPHAVDPRADYDGEAPTQVSLEIEDDPEGVVLTMTESGFSWLPVARRTVAFLASERAWERRMLLLKQRVEGRFGARAPFDARFTELRAERA
jgi:hypothetical protein